MNIISWNIDGLNAALTGTSERAKLSRATLEKIAHMNPEIIAIQETKLSELTSKHKKVLDEIFPNYKYDHAVSEGKKGYAGTMILYKKGIIHKPHLLKEEVNEGRVITLETDDFYLVNVYTPNSSKDLIRLDYRMRWDDDFRNYLTQLKEDKPVIACGDFNVAHTPLDLKNPKGNAGKSGYTDEERAKFTELLNVGFVDAHRYIHGDIPHVYTWWTQLSKTAKRNNSGWRIDYFLVDEVLKDDIVSIDVIDTGERKDHAPVSIKLKT